MAIRTVRIDGYFQALGVVVLLLHLLGLWQGSYMAGFFTGYCISTGSSATITLEDDISEQVQEAEGPEPVQQEAEGPKEE